MNGDDKINCPQCEQPIFREDITYFAGSSFCKECYLQIELRRERNFLRDVLFSCCMCFVNIRCSNVTLDFIPEEWERELYIPYHYDYGNGCAIGAGFIRNIYFCPSCIPKKQIRQIFR